MATSAIPAVIDALLEQATATLPAILVLDGYGVTDDPGDFLMVGVDDPDSEVAANSADSQQSRANVGQSGDRTEDGEITCAALSWNGAAGDVGAKAARDGVFAITSALEGLLRASPDLGLGPTIWTNFGTQLELYQQQGEGGSSALVVFRIGFHATRI